MELSNYKIMAARYPKVDSALRLHMLGRALLCPFHRVLACVPQSGCLLDVGCGAGFWLNYLRTQRPGLSLVGVDIDSRKISQAKPTEDDSLQFLCGDLLDSPLGDFQCVSIFDVLYLLPRADKITLLRRCRELMAPGGKLILKEVSDHPRWKSSLAYMEEIFAVKVFKFTMGGGLHFPSSREWSGIIEEAGLELVEAKPIDRGYPHPHLLLVARPAAETA